MPKILKIMWLVCKSNPYKLEEDPRFTSLYLHHFSGSVGLTTQFSKSALRDVTEGISDYINQ